jgi:hypothetical protein
LGTPQALEAAESERWQLQGQNARVEAEKRRHLAWCGTALIGSSLGTLAEAVDQIRAAFLLPEKELKCARGHSSCLALPPLDSFSWL